MKALLEGLQPLPRSFLSGEEAISPARVAELLAPFISEDRAARIESVVAERAAGIAVVVDGLANSGNVAAVMRSAEGLGYLHFHAIARKIPYKHSRRTTQGADKWLDSHAWKEAGACLDALKDQGYRLVATHLDERALPIGDLDFTIPTAMIFGNELGGVSREVLAQVDATCIIPMSGFAESFNISVAAATCLYHARQDRIARQGRHGDLTLQQQQWLRAAYAYRAVSFAQSILDRGGG